MTIASALTALNTDITNARTAITTKGGTVTSGGGSSQLATDIATIPTSSAVLTTKNITVNGTYNASSDNADGYSSVTVAVPGGAKYGATIDDLLPDIYSNNGKWARFSFTPISINLSALRAIDNDSSADYLKYKFYNRRINSIDLSNLETITSTYNYSCEGAFADTEAVTSLNLSSLTTISNETNGVGICKYMFKSCSSDGIASARLILSIPELTSISGNEACYGMFTGCSNTSSISLPKLATISGSYACTSMFTSNRNATTVDLSALESISEQYACYDMFGYCTSLTSIDLSSLETITGYYACNRMFENCTSLTSISFPSLVSNFSSGDTTVFNYMLQYVTGCTVHFPSNLQSEIESWYDITHGFGGTNTTVLFDLPSTAS